MAQYRQEQDSQSPQSAPARDWKQPKHQADERDLVQQAFEELEATLEQLRTANKQLEQQMEQNAQLRRQLDTERQRYSDLTELLHDAYMLTDQDGVIFEANRAARQQMGVKVDSSRKTVFYALIAAEEKNAVLTLATQALEAEEPQSLIATVLPFPFQSARKRTPLAARITVRAVRHRGHVPTALQWLIRTQAQEDSNISLPPTETAEPL